MQNILREIARKTEDRLEALFDEVTRTGNPGILNESVASAPAAQVRDLTLRAGKRVRAALIACGAGLFEDGAFDNPAVIDAAAAMELLHTYFLIHDDIMDQDPTRRGAPSVHVALRAQVGDQRIGTNLAILAGDLACALHERLVASLDVPEDRRRRAAGIFSRVHLDVIHGQTLDLLGTADPEEISRRKTASYTTVGPLAIGAALGGAQGDQLVQVAQIAEPLGVAFQLKDDLLGIFGEPTITGKPVGSDLINGKNTYILSHAREAVSRMPQRRSALEAALGNPNASRDQVSAAMEVLVDSGALAACEQRINHLIEGARRDLEKQGYLAEGRHFLEWIADKLARRDT